MGRRPEELLPTARTLSFVVGGALDRKVGSEILILTLKLNILIHDCFLFPLGRPSSKDVELSSSSVAFSIHSSLRLPARRTNIVVGLRRSPFTARLEIDSFDGQLAARNPEFCLSASTLPLLQNS